MRKVFQISVTIVTFACLSAVGRAENRERLVAITIDDLPGVPTSATLKRLQLINRLLLKTLRDEKIPAIGFVNERVLHVEGERDERVAILHGWLDAGMSLGNHTYGHSDLSTTPLSRYQDDVIKGEVVIRQLMEGCGHKLTFFRHPYTHTGLTKEIKEAFERFLSERDYRIAPFTIEACDYAFEALRRDAEAAGDGNMTRRLLAEYVSYNDHVFAWSEKLSRELFGREIPQILLIHDSLLNAESLPEILSRLHGRGYRFITMGEALADPAYSTPDEYVGEHGISWLYRWSVALGRPSRAREHPNPPAWIIESYRRRTSRSHKTDSR